jgi:spermidine synthase
MGDLRLRRRLDPVLQVDVFEAMLGEEHLMSSLFTVAEIELARLGLAAVDGGDLDVVVGGLGLGYTAAAALDDPRARAVHVVEALPAVIGWHQDRLLPESDRLVDDPRCHLVEGDLFALVRDGASLGTGAGAPVHAVLLDVDHTPHHLLHPRHADLYTAEGLGRLRDRLHPGGVFALWSDRPDEGFLAVARSVFGRCDEHVVAFPNHHTGRDATNAVYVATDPG